MPRQTDQANYQFPRRIRLGSINWTSGMGPRYRVLLAAGATKLTLNWDEMRIDAGNYLGLIKKAKNFTCALAPSALWNWDPAKIVKVFDGILSSMNCKLILQQVRWSLTHRKTFSVCQCYHQNNTSVNKLVSIHKPTNRGRLASILL